MYYVYVIQSLKDQSFYIGRTSDLERRLKWHNSEEENIGVTKRKIPWQYYHIIEVSDQHVADKIERHIKRMKSRKYLKDLARYPEMSERLVEKYS